MVHWRVGCSLHIDEADAGLELANCLLLGDENLPFLAITLDLHAKTILNGRHLAYAHNLAQMVSLAFDFADEPTNMKISSTHSKMYRVKPGSKYRP